MLPNHTSEISAAEYAQRYQMRATPEGKLLLRAGFEPYDTETSARRVAEHAVKELAEWRAALERAMPWLGKAHAEGLNKGCVMPNDLPATIAQAQDLLNR